MPEDADPGPSRHRLSPRASRESGPLQSGAGGTAPGRRSTSSRSSVTKDHGALPTLRLISDLAAVLGRADSRRRTTTTVVRAIANHLDADGGAVLAATPGATGPAIVGQWWRSDTSPAAPSTLTEVVANAEPNGERPWASFETRVDGTTLHLVLRLPPGGISDADQRGLEIAARLLGIYWSYEGLPDDGDAPDESTFVDHDVLRRLCEVLVPRIADVALVYLFEEHGLYPAQVCHQDADRTDVLRDVLRGCEPIAPTDPDHPLATLDWRHGPVTRTVARAPDPLHEHGGLDEPVGLLVLPLATADHVLGVVMLVTEDDSRITAADVELAQLATSSTVPALAHTHLVEQAEATAAALRSAAIPSTLPDVPGWDFAALFEPMQGGGGVGGDWYDVVRHQDGTVDIVVGDVVGHGPNAAAVMTRLRNSLQAYLGEGHDLVSSVSLLNRLLRGGGPDELAAVTCARLHPPTGELELVRCGSLPSLTLRADGSVDTNDTPVGPLLGAFEAPEYRAHRLTVAPGEVVVIATDGVVESPDEDLVVSLERFGEFLTARPSGPLALVADMVRPRVDDGRRRRDDACFVALERAPLELTQVRRSVPPSTAAISKQRRAIRRWLGAQDVTGRPAEDTELIVAELLANAMEASPDGGDIGLELLLTADRITVVVVDSGGGFDLGATLGADRDALSARGRGLEIVQAASEWFGVERRHGRTRVRAVLRRPVVDGAGPTNGGGTAAREP